MICKKLPSGKLVLFNKHSGVTSYFSGQELEHLKKFCTTRTVTPFILRLLELRIFEKDDVDVIYSKALSKDDDRPLKSIHFEITEECPLSCPVCYKASARTEIMELNRFCRLLADAENLSVFQIALGGGEPLTHPQIAQFVEAVGCTEMSCTLTTSGAGLNEQLLKQLEDAGLNHMQISLDSIDEEINILTRDGYNHAINAINLLQHSKLSKGINIIVHEKNLDSLEDTVNHAVLSGFNNVNLLRYKPNGNTPYIPNAISEKGFCKLLHILKGIKGIKVTVDSANSYILKSLHGEKTFPFNGCGAFIDFIAVTANGQFKPCSHIPRTDTCGSINEYISMDIKVSAPGGCKGCRYILSCKGCAAIDEKIGETKCHSFKR